MKNWRVWGCLYSKAAPPFSRWPRDIMQAANNKKPKSWRLTDLLKIVLVCKSQEHVSVHFFHGRDRFGLSHPSEGLKFYRQYCWNWPQEDISAKRYLSAKRQDQLHLMQFLMICPTCSNTPAATPQHPPNASHLLLSSNPRSHLLSLWSFKP